MSLNDAKRESSSSQSRRAGSPDRRSLGRTSQTSPRDYSTRKSTRRRSCALSATTMVDRLISTAPTAGAERDPGPGERAGGERNGDHVVSRPPTRGSGPSCGSSRRRGGSRRRRRGGRSTRARRRRIRWRRRCRRRWRCRRRRGQRGRVVDAVTDHGDGQAARLELGDLGVLVLGKDLGHHLVDAELACRPLRRPDGRRR